MTSTVFRIIVWLCDFGEISERSEIAKNIASGFQGALLDDDRNLHMSDHPIIDSIDDLIQRTEKCADYTAGKGLKDADETEHPYIAAHIINQREMFQLDDSVVRFCNKVRGREPQPNEWTDHYQQLEEYFKRKGYYPRTSLEGWANTKFQLRRTKAFVRELLAEQLYELNMYAAKTPHNKREFVMGHVIHGNSGQIIVDSKIDKTVLRNTINTLEERSEFDIAEFVKELSNFVNNSGIQEAVELTDQLNEELSRSEPRKSLVRRSWEGLVSVLPAVKEMAGAAGAIAKFFG
ncbi:hypothetical protein ABZT49_03880 [Methylobacterium sp. EM32]|uniref:hypothetical protein n=1 Tax=Methylobacterium sp. EM32 TaxID=3163481 RepID=UPI0033A5B6C7